LRAGDSYRHSSNAAPRQRRATNDALLKHAERVTLVDNDRLTMNLRLWTLPER
jgi:hypothetical protein